ncbi:hypothetical protein M6B38_346595 [Iris pallida]|uniref:Uncharacterized protein n=1 Tax=Iris pallida TaxID=29817 RepID=A0AAX6GUE8_IRIPA|nr:hypothetical protein M6B38_346595 [Iris pallida]
MSNVLVSSMVVSNLSRVGLLGTVSPLQIRSPLPRGGSEYRDIGLFVSSIVSSCGVSGAESSHGVDSLLFEFEFQFGLCIKFFEFECVI